MTSDADHVTSQSGHMTLDQSVDGNVEVDSKTLEDDSHSSSNHDNNYHGDNSTTECGGHQSVRDLHWLIGRMARLARYEAGRHPQQSLKVLNHTVR